VAGLLLDILNQPLVVFVLLAGTGGFLIVGEVRMIAREFRRPAGGGPAASAASVGSPGLGRRYRLTLLAAAGLLLVSAFGTTSASFTQQELTAGQHVGGPTTAPTHAPATAPPTTAPTTAPTDVPAPT